MLLLILSTSVNFQSELYRSEYPQKTDISINNVGVIPLWDEATFHQKRSAMKDEIERLKPGYDQHLIDIRGTRRKRKRRPKEDPLVSLCDL